MKEMSFNMEKLLQKAKPASEEALKEAQFRDENRGWLKKSALISLAIERHLRLEKMSKLHFADLIGVSSAQVTKILSGKENLQLKTITKIEEALGIELVTVSDLNPVYSIRIENVSAINSRNGALAFEGITDKTGEQKHINRYSFASAECMSA